MKRFFFALGLWLLIAATGCTSPMSATTATPPSDSMPTPMVATPTILENSPPGNNAGEPATATPTYTGPLRDERFDQALAQAFESRDFPALRAMMRARFSFATWNTELVEVSADEAIQRLQETWLADGSQPKAKFGTDVPALLSGTDPLSLWGPLANPIRAMHVTGLGQQAASEAVLVVGRDASTGQIYWHGMLLPPANTFQKTSTESFEVNATTVTRVMAKQTVNLRSGPGMEFDVLTTLDGGETAPVDAVSPDGKWWRSACTLNASGFCWISTDPAFTEPVQDAP